MLTPNLICSLTAKTHHLLLLADSALPLGSFAFSSGLESYLSHQKHYLPSSPQGQPSPVTVFISSFLPLSLSSYAATSLPFVLAAARLVSQPSQLTSAALTALDDAQDAAIPCVVARRASIAQGRALLGIWERSFDGVVRHPAAVTEEGAKQAEEALRGFATLVRKSSSSTSASSSASAAAPTTMDEDAPPAASAHLAPLFGAVASLLGLAPEEAAYVFLLGHVKALVSAAVRAGMFGPYQAQRTLAGGEVHEMITAMVEREWETEVGDAGQTVPVMDLWVGRHELLYSRIFNS